MTTDKLARPGRTERLGSIVQAQTATPLGWLRGQIDVATTFVLSRAFYAMAPSLERCGVIFPAVDPDDTFTLSDEGRLEADLLIAMREQELALEGSAAGEASLVEPTDLDHVPDLEFVVDAPFHIAKGTVTTLYGLGG